MPAAPPLRVTNINDAPIRESGRYVLYWMTAQRRTQCNFALEHAATMARSLGRGLVILEALRVDYRWASDRLHSFVLDGMADNARACANSGVRYFPYVEAAPGAGKGLLAALAADACLVITDEFPGFFLPEMLRAAGRDLDVRLEAVDGNGLLPLRAAGRAHTVAHGFRRALQKILPEHLGVFPQANPLSSWAKDAPIRLPSKLTQRWPAVSKTALVAGSAARARLLASLPIDHSIEATATIGGSVAGARSQKIFFARKLVAYGSARNQPEEDVASGFSPYLHFGHISVHQIVRRIFERDDWSISRLPDRVHGKRAGWWRLSPESEAFMDELITWRELGYGFAFYRPEDYHDYASLPDWAFESLALHESDPREHVYTLEQFEQSHTHDELWNAAQTQLRRDGKIHNYLRMLWGKKILHWTQSPRDALAIMIELNNKYALDGRNPNSYSGIFWTLGRFDRAWGPEREIFGKVRYMTSENTAKKLRVRSYIEKYR